MRLDQFVSQATGLSRSHVQGLIRAGRVAVAGITLNKPPTQIDPLLTVTLDNAPITLPTGLYLMLHKPAGVVSATEDVSHRTVLDIVNHPHRHTLHVVGRLDKDTTGLLLITNDGNWSHRLTSPKHHVPKTYLATLAEPLTPAAAQQLAVGVLLHGEKQAVQASNLHILPACQVRLTLHEGKYHQVKRMLAAVGNHVLALHREQIGGLRLPDELALGRMASIK